MTTTYEIEIHAGVIDATPLFKWASQAPFMVPTVGSLIDIPGYGGAHAVTQTAMNLVPAGPGAMRQILYVVVA
ncbi:hypothetical protein [Ensifer soli]|uniref:hypothetical protein n=1 Tax=Ciceribacter sp. sgz301302 TaxID=3342379 RepID=UPI0035BA59CE